MPIACYRITAKIVAKTPLHIGSGRRTGIIKHTLPYVPGSFIRGATGASIIKSVCRKDRPLKDHEKCEFFEECEYADLYGEEVGKSSRIFFRYAYPIHLACDGGLYLPAPKTMFVCENPQCEKIYDRIMPPIKCEVCGKSLKPVKGFVCTNCEKITETPISMNRITLTAIDRKHQSAAQILVPKGRAGTLHAIDVVEVGAQFSLETIVDSKASQYLTLIKNTLSESLPDEGIGGSKSRGLGKVALENVTAEEITADVLERRAEEIDTSWFGVKLISPMILAEDKLLDDSALLEAARRAYAWCLHEGKPKLPEIKLAEKSFSYETCSGWSLKEQRRRRIETAISPGSVFQFRSVKHDEILALALAALELYAIGSYKPHGCGQLIIEKPR